MKATTPYPLSSEIQAFVDGELDHAAGTNLLRELDNATPSNCRWRELSLALVERDLLRSAFAAAGERETVVPSRRSLWASWATFAAACLALGCFALGWQLKPAPPMVADSSPASERAGADPASPPVSPTSIVERANAELSDTGYEASLVTRFVRTSLKDGGEAVIPISQVMLDYRGL